ncbi:MAG: hypothetical protein JWO88_1050 [Frankiales bacterium]|nr:hypothetical protein [Frankiales bacterium]
MDRTWARAGALSGIAFVALVVASNVAAGGIPDPSASPTKVIAFYTAHKTGQQVSATLTAAAVVVGLYFFWGLRNYLDRVGEGEQLATLGFVGAVVFGVGGCINAGLQWSLAAVPTKLTPAAAQALNVLFKDDLATGLYNAGLATLMLFYGVAMLRSKGMPTWLGWISVALGLIALAGPLVFLVFIVTAPWAITVSILLYRRDRGAVVSR